MDCPYCPGSPDSLSPRAGRLPLWVPFLLIVAVLGAAALASALVPPNDPAPASTGRPM